MFKNLNLLKYNLRLEPSMFDQSTWIVNPSQTNATMQRNIEFLNWKTLFTETLELSVWTQVLMIYTKFIKTT
jgi:hypothetical protein